jgi:ADP-ribose pyrophosphatase
MLQPWKLIKEEVEFQNKYVRIDKRRYELPNGEQADYFIRDGIGNVASVLAVSKEKKFILAQEFRPGPNMIMDELPGGLIDEGEEPLQAAERELYEETGYKGKLIFLGETYVSAYSRVKKFCFLALDCEQVKHEVQEKEEEYEFIEVVLKEKADFLLQVQKGELTDLETALLGLNYLEKSDLL